MQTTPQPSAIEASAWPAALALTAIAGTLATACMMPFVALAAMAAATLPRGRAMATVGAAWGANQIIGFTLLNYPPTAYAFSWGAALGVAALAVVPVARHIARPGHLSAIRLLAAFAAGFIVYEALLFGFAHLAGGVGSFTPAIVARIALNDGGWFVALAAIHLALTSGAPRWFGARPALRLA